MEELINKKLEVLEQLLDDRCELYGIRNTISYLMDYGLTAEELIGMKFDKEDVDYVFDHPTEIFDLE